jgi:hypothetical protein
MDNAGLKHAFKRYLFGKTWTFHLGPDGLAVNGEEPIAFNEISHVSLSRHRVYKKPWLTHGECRLTTKSKAAVVLQSIHVRGAGQFADRNDTYVPMVRELLASVHGGKPDATFELGSNALRIIFLCAVATFAILTIPLTAAALGGAGIVATAAALTSACLAVGFWLNYRAQARKPFDPQSPPEDVLSGSSQESEDDLKHSD